MCLQGHPTGDEANVDEAEEFTGGSVDGEELVGAGSGCDERFVIGADLDREGSGESLCGDDLCGRERLEVDEVWFPRALILEINPGDLVEKGAVLKFGEALFFGAGAAVDVVAGIGLGDENRAFGVDGQPVEKGAEGINGFDEAVGFGIEDKEVFVGKVRMFDDVADVFLGVVGGTVLVDIEGGGGAFDFGAAGELGFVVGLEGDDVEFAVADGDGAWVLGRDGEEICDPTGGNVDDGDFIF